MFLKTISNFTIFSPEGILREMVERQILWGKVI